MNIDTIFHEGKKRFATGYPGDSIDLFTKAAAEGCNPVNVYLNRGAAYLSVGDHEDAEADFSRVLEIDEDHERAHYFRGVARLILGNLEGSVEDLTASLAINHERGVAFLARGIAFAELGREDEALNDFKTATVFSSVEVGNFLSQFSSHRTMFDRSMALLEGERGPWKAVMTEEEVEKTRQWFA
jgi:tetratricopeptide (TPR) repeat protein